MAPYAAALKSYFPKEAAIGRYLELVRSVSSASAGYFAQKALPQSRAEDVYDRMCGGFHDHSDRLTIDVLSELTDDRELIAVICANWGDYSLEPTKSSFAMHCMLAKHYLNGGHYPVGGGAAFARSIVPIIEGAGGMVLHSAEVAEIIVSQGRTTGVRLASGEEFACPLVISNAGVQNTFGRLLSAQVRTALGLDQAISQVVESYAVVGANIGFNRSAGELGFDGANIWAHPSNDFEANLEADRRDFEAPFPWHRRFRQPRIHPRTIGCPEQGDSGSVWLRRLSAVERWSGTRWMKRGEDYLVVKEKIRERLLDELFRHVPAARSALDYVRDIDAAKLRNVCQA